MIYWVNTLTYEKNIFYKFYEIKVNFVFNSKLDINQLESQFSIMILYINYLLYI